MTRRRRLALFWLLAGVSAVPASAATTDTVAVYAAGSLRGVVAALSIKAASMGITLVPSFAGSGDLRARIEQGATPDLLLSADMASPRRLAAGGRTSEPAIAFAANRLCLVARRSLGLTAANLVPRLLAKDVRIRTSTPIADPSGDYAMAMFDLMDAAHPGAGKRLRANADAQMAVSAPGGGPGATTTASLFGARLIDVAVTYCSASGELAASSPDLVSIPVPAAFDPKPLFGLALLSSRPAALRLALLLLSDDGQAAVLAAGLIPLAGDPSRSR